MTPDTAARFRLHFEAMGAGSRRGIGVEAAPMAPSPLPSIHAPGGFQDVHSPNLFRLTRNRCLPPGSSKPAKQPDHVRNFGGNDTRDTPIIYPDSLKIRVGLLPTLPEAILLPP